MQPQKQPLMELLLQQGLVHPPPLLVCLMPQHHLLDLLFHHLKVAILQVAQLLSMVTTNKEGLI